MVWEGMVANLLFLGEVKKQRKMNLEGALLTFSFSIQDLCS